MQYGTCPNPLAHRLLFLILVPFVSDTFPSLQCCVFGNWNNRCDSALDWFRWAWRSIRDRLDQPLASIAVEEDVDLGGHVVGQVEELLPG